MSSIFEDHKSSAVGITYRTSTVSRLLSYLDDDAKRPDQYSSVASEENVIQSSTQQDVTQSRSSRLLAVYRLVSGYLPTHQTVVARNGILL